MPKFSVTEPSSFSVPPNGINLSYSDYKRTDLQTLYDNNNTPYIKLHSTPFRDFDASPLRDLPYSHTFLRSQRKALYYGNVPYSYGQVYHPVYQMADGSITQHIFYKICSLFPNLSLNTVLIQLYRSLEASIPFHVDNEREICPKSYIITLSFGATRSIVFRGIGWDNYSTKCDLKHGDVLIMSRGSQDVFEHGILQEPNSPSDRTDNNAEYRISLTFRHINKTTLRLIF